MRTHIGRMDPVLFTILSLVWGSSFILMDRANLAFGPISIGSLGSIGGGLALAMIWRHRRTACRIHRRHLAPLAWIVLIGFCWPFSIQPYLIERIGHGYVGTAVSLVPIMTIALQIPMLRLHPTRTQLVGVLLGFVFLFAYFWDGLDRKVGGVDVALACSIPFSYAFANVMVKRSVSDIPAVPMACIGLLAGGLLLLPAALAIETIETGPKLLLAGASLLLLALLSRGICSAFFYTLVHHRGPLYAGLVSNTIPFVVLGWSWFDNEAVTPKQIIAVVGAIAMVIVVQRDIRPESAET